MLLRINGVEHELRDVRTILDVIEFFGLLGKPVVAEADGKVLTAEQWPDTPVTANMSIELVHFVGGG
ncbi:thiamine biosynthesis protein ThiS [Paenibacillus vortex V453]|uniref:Thiamine biosynthesis protein ThiS n=1 Tax=Paenibacillus vortex V453 TaxID=715225 RepID=A0A2R9SY96_9BACL|nr:MULTISPECIES: sulfur carrier protein ThiS [Paenibacillus]AWP29261.1 thiamine biosynthesis protein ThiS [Paenibacillus sp. Cedars]EFU42369.1 thiamine biosynthesis protein ThiS [Paenibacillus vortex V453]MDH6672490.1 sulfur carrier protein [Paenibacillus sp. LBL]